MAAQAPIDPAPLMLRLDLRPDGAKVVGRITNESGRAVEDVTLLLDGAYERLGHLAPGAGVEVNWTPSVRYGTGGPTYGPGPPASAPRCTPPGRVAVRTTTVRAGPTWDRWGGGPRCSTH